MYGFARGTAQQEVILELLEWRWVVVVLLVDYSRAQPAVSGGFRYCTGSATHESSGSVVHFGGSL